MEFLFWFLEFCPKPFMGLLFFIVIIGMLEAASSRSTTEEKQKENLDKKKNGVEEPNLGNKGSKDGIAKKSKKKRRVKFEQDVLVEKVDHFEDSNKPCKDFELSENLSEKIGFLDKSLERRLVVERGEDSKIMEDVDDVVVVRKVDHFEGSDEPLEVFELSENRFGLLEGLDVGRGEGSLYQIEDEGGHKESEVMLCGEKLAEGCSDVNMIKDVKADVEGTGSKNLGLLVEGKNEVAIISDYCGVKSEDVVTSGLEGFVVEHDINIDAIGGEDRLILMNDDFGVEKCNAASGERLVNNAGLFEKELETKALDGGKFTNDDVVIAEIDATTRETGESNLLAEFSDEVLQREAVNGKNGMALMNDDVVTDESHGGVEKEVPNKGEVLEEELDREAVDIENGSKLISDDVRIDEIDAAPRERAANNLLTKCLGEVLDEVLEREAGNGMALMNDDVVNDESHSVVENKAANNDEDLEEELEREVVDGENGGLQLVSGGALIDESDAAARERVASKAEFVEEELEREAVEEKSEDAAGDLDKISGGEKDNTHLVSGGLENLVIEKVIKSKEFGYEGMVGLVSDNVASPQTEESGEESANVNDVIATGKGYSEVSEGEESILRNLDVGTDDDDDDDDDWEGVESSELEKVFAEAVNYVECGPKTKDDRSASLSNVKMLLYGLHKLAVQGPCHVPQPMALKVSARAKW